MTAVPFGRPVSSSVPVRGQDALVHPLEDPPRILRGDVYVAADDAGLPASDGTQLLFARAFARQVCRSAVPQVVELEVSELRRFNRSPEALRIVEPAAA